MTDRRTFITGLAAAPLSALPVAAQAATGLLCLPTDATTETEAWQCLQKELVAASAAYEASCTLESDAEGRFFSAKPPKPERKTEDRIILPGGQTWEYTRTLDRGDVETPDGDYYDHPLGEELRAEWKEYDRLVELAKRNSGLDVASDAQMAALNQHCEAMERCFLFPTANPAIIAEKLKLVIQEYYDENGHIAQIANAILIGASPSSALNRRASA